MVWWGVGLVAVYWSVMAAMQRRLLFPAPRGAAVVPRVDGLVAMTLPSPAGPMPAWWLPPRGDGSPSPALIFLHGNGERGEDWLASFGALREAGVGVLVPEYPGYGNAPGQPTETSLDAAADSARAWLERQPFIDRSRVVLHGRSLGGGVAARMAAHRAPAALVLESTFRSIRHLARERLVPPWLVRDPFDSERAVAGYRGPALVLHGLSDRLIPVSHGRALARAMPGATFVGLSCGHDDCPPPWVTVLAFLQRSGVLRDAAPVHAH